MQKVLTVSTTGGTLRSEIEGWRFEDSNLVVLNKPIGFTPVPKHWPTYKTILNALADGWHLLGPPTLVEKLPVLLPARTEVREVWNWWLVKD